MAMSFRDATLRRAYLECFQRAAARAGFDLRTLDDPPKAGLIDDRLKVAILSSAFVVADVTGNNQGVYWEAGFAHGRGKPVIYTCEQTAFERDAPHSAGPFTPPAGPRCRRGIVQKAHRTRSPITAELKIPG